MTKPVSKAYIETRVIIAGLLMAALAWLISWLFSTDFAQTLAIIVVADMWHSVTSLYYRATNG